MKLNRRDFLKLAGVSGAGLLVRSMPYTFDWLHDVPPSLMLHSANLQFFPELLPAIEENFTPMTYKAWLAKLARLDWVTQWFAATFNLERQLVAGAIGRQAVDRLPLILSIDDIGTDWVRYEHLAMIKELEANGIPAVVGVQPKVMPVEEARYWDRLLELYESGWEISTHTINHPPLTHVNEAKATYEITESCDRIEQVIGERPVTLITPFGDSNPPDDTSPGNKQLYQLAQQAGIKVIAGIRDGRERLSSQVREDLRSEYPDGDLPEYVGRIAPDPSASITVTYLRNFKRGGYEAGTSDP